MTAPAAPMSADGIEWDERLTRTAVRGRSLGWCEWCGKLPGTDMHHRRNASQGGKWHPANILHLCRGCHHAVTVNPDWAHMCGLTLRAGQDPATTPVVDPGVRDWYPSDLIIAKAGKNA